jgi:hypothetical protein
MSEWQADQCTLGGNPNDERIIAAYVVGPSGKVLLDAYKESSDVHWETTAALRAATNNPKAGQPLPLLKEKTRDMVECHRVKVRRV